MKALRGQISIITALSTAFATIAAAGLMAWGTSSASIASVKEQSSVLQEREQNHYGEVQKRLDTIDGKLDRLLENNAVITKSI